mgnify:CR=1 FL=1
MARPPKDGVDYFPFDVDTDNDTKFQIIEAKYGVVGFGIIVKLFQMIYRNGYYCKWDELVSIISASKWSSNQYPIKECDVRAVVKEAAKYGIFDKELLNKYGILTSKGIQKRYFEIVKRRSKINAENNYLLISVPKTHIDVDNNGVYVCKNPENVSNNTQRKGKESKGKYIRESKRKNSPPTLEEIKNFVKDKNLKVNGEKFFYYYSAKGWDGISDWKSKLLEWNATERPEKEETSFAAYDIDEFERMLNEKE